MRRAISQSGRDRRVSLLARMPQSTIGHRRNRAGMTMREGGGGGRCTRQTDMCDEHDVSDGENKIIASSSCFGIVERLRQRVPENQTATVHVVGSRGAAGAQVTRRHPQQSFHPTLAAMAWKATLAPVGVRLVTRIRMRPSGSTVRRVTDKGSDSPGKCSSTMTALRSNLALRATRAPPSPSLASTLAPLKGSSSSDVPRRSAVIILSASSPLSLRVCSSVVDWPARLMRARCQEAKPKASRNSSMPVRSSMLHRPMKSASLPLAARPKLRDPDPTRRKRGWADHASTSPPEESATIDCRVSKQTGSTSNSHERACLCMIHTSGVHIRCPCVHAHEHFSLWTRRWLTNAFLL
mmetsp:Transcript_48550/g.96790  ORF Transcript_48550/g.96790 Transcript_48550/m.96790 type:complete len:352 (+) Transcript_48550:248-1303(+)